VRGPTPLGALVPLFLRLGFAGFGGPLVHVAMMARGALVSPFTALVGLAAAGILWHFKADTVWLVLGAGVAGWLWSLVG